MAIQIFDHLSNCRALKYLHSMDVTHGTIKSRKILLDSSKPAKLVDGNMKEDDNEKTKTARVCKFHWTAPEILMGDVVSASPDINSFGVVLSGLDTHLVSYEDIIHAESGRPLSCMMKTNVQFFLPRIDSFHGHAVSVTQARRPANSFAVG
ncbi:hypothetical protein AC1031_022011 [Aphanomyces cochlioides]|nr:hypothetical protein AC1031_022011 [Aphanomyces cochlioides]